MPEEEILGEEEATAADEEEESAGGGGGLLDLGGMGMDSMAVKILLGAIVIVAIIVVVIFITNYVLEAWMVGTQPRDDSDVSETTPDRRTRDPYATMELAQDFIISKENPRTGRTRTMKVRIFLAFNPGRGVGALRSELDARMPQIRDRIYGILGRKSYEELDYAYKQELQDEIVSEINRLLTTDYRIQEVFFSEFVIQ